MGNEKIKQVECLAAKILRTYFCESDMEFMISTFADDIVWLGAGEKQKAEGREAVAAAFRAGKDEMIPFDMSDEQYETLELGGGNYLCEGVSCLKAKQDTGMCLEIVQRVTFVFREKGNRLETVHIHNSIPYTGIRDDELFPVESARQAYMELENALRKSEQDYMRQAQFLSQLYNSVPCGIVQFDTDSEYKVINVNRMVWDFYGYDSEEEYRRENPSPFGRVRPEDKSWVINIIDGLKLNGETASYTRESFRKNGEQVFIRVFMDRIVNANGQEVIQAVFTDITNVTRLQREQAREQLMENRSLRAAICTVYPLIMSLNLSKDTFQCFVEDQEGYLGQKEGIYSRLIAQYAEDVYPSYREDYLRTFNREEIIRSFQSGKKEVYMEMQQKGVDGKYHWISIHIVAVDNPFNEDVMAINMTKILDSQRAEQARQEQLLRDALAAANAANRAKSDFLSRMSHDIRTPMNAIIGMSAIGQMKSQDVECVQDCFRKIDASSQYLLSIINDILDMSKIENGKMEITSVPFAPAAMLEEINDIIRPQAEEKGLYYKIENHEPLDLCCIGDELRLKQILMNLLSNALKFTPEGGRVEVDIREKTRRDSVVYLEMEVRDTGIGMSEEFMERIFQPFEQENPELARNYVGSGLGLSIVYNLVQLMNGTLEVQSCQGKGSDFLVVIPLRLVRDMEGREDADELGKVEEKPYGNSSVQGKRVLLVEDNDLNMEIAKELLEMCGLQVEGARDGKEAVELVEVNPPDYYGAVLMDIRMPVMDGIEATRRIRSMGRADTGKLPIIAMTANAFEEDKKAAEQAGMSGYLVKPIDMEAVIEELERVM